MFDQISFVRYLSEIETRLHARFFGKSAGEDTYGLRYYEMGRKDWAGRESRWVLYTGAPEASRIPPNWRAWLNHLCDRPLQNDLTNGYVWLKPHIPNLTGSEAALFPAKPSGKATDRSSWIWSPVVDEF